MAKTIPITMRNSDSCIAPLYPHPPPLNALEQLSIAEADEFDRSPGSIPSTVRSLPSPLLGPRIGEASSSSGTTVAPDVIASERRVDCQAAGNPLELVLATRKEGQLTADHKVADGAED